jgi:Cohesin domain/PEP-CTERM motif
MFKKILCTAVLLIGNIAGAHAAPTLSVLPVTSTVGVGDTFSLDIAIAGVSDLYGWELDLGFGPAGLLSASPATEGSFLGAGTTFDGGTVDNAGGAITTMFSALSGPVGVSGDGVLAHVSFEALASGFATVSLLRVMLVDANLDQIFFSYPGDAFAATVEIGRGATVPEPSTLALIALALAMVPGVRRLSRQKLTGAERSS